MRILIYIFITTAAGIGGFLFIFLSSFRFMYFVINENMKLRFIIAVVVGIITALGAFVVTWQTMREEDTDKKK